MSIQPEPELELLYELNKHQVSTLVFAEDEIRFLKGLIDRYFKYMIEDVSINRAQLINTHISELVTVKEKLVKSVEAHKENLSLIISDCGNTSIYPLKLQNERIEDGLRDLANGITKTKKDIFAIYKNLPSNKSAADNSVL